MKISVLKVAASVSLACSVPIASSAVLTFDDLNGFDFFVGSYQGFTFGTGNKLTTAWLYDNVDKSPFIAQSQPTHVGTDYQLYTPGVKFEDAQPITNPVDFKFDGAYFSGYRDVQVKYKLYLDGNLVYTSAASSFLSPVPQYIASGYSGLVDSVVISSEQGYYAMDNFTYNSPPIPEPGALALMTAGLGMVGFMVRRRRYD